MQVLIHLEKLRHNVAYISDICRSAGLQPVWITKGCQAHPAILELLAQDTHTMVGDVSAANLDRACRVFPDRVMMVQLPDRDRVAAIGACAQMWLVSDPAHAQVIASAAGSQSAPREVILMVDVGNRREGVLPEQAVARATAIEAIEGVVLTGMGTSVGCYGGYLAGRGDMERRLEIALATEAQLGRRFEVLSAGSGTMLLELAVRGQMPNGINQLRIGAALFVGEMPPTRTPIPGLYQDAFIFEGEVLETSLKPSLPAGRTGPDAFGKQVVFEENGPRQLCILNFGLLDVDAYDLSPLTPGLRIVGTTSNYTICDTTRCDSQPAIGETLSFRMAYSAMARAMASDDVTKRVIPAS